jgi:hypothetical protein
MLYTNIDFFYENNRHPVPSHGYLPGGWYLLEFTVAGKRKVARLVKR